MSKLDSATQAAAAMSAFLDQTNRYAAQQRQQEIQALQFLGQMDQYTVSPDPNAQRAGFLSRLFGYDYKPRGDRMPVVALGGTPFTITNTPTIGETFPDLAGNELLGAAAPYLAQMPASPNNKKLAIGALMDLDKQKRGHVHDKAVSDAQLDLKLSQLRNDAVSDYYTAASEAGVKMADRDYGTIPLDEVSRLYGGLPKKRHKDKDGNPLSSSTKIMEKVGGVLEKVSNLLGGDQELATMLLANGKKPDEVDRLLAKMGKDPAQRLALSNAVKWYRTQLDKYKMELEYYQDEPGALEAARFLDTLTASDTMDPAQSSIYPRSHQRPGVTYELNQDVEPGAFEGSTGTPGKPRLRIRGENLDY